MSRNTDTRRLIGNIFSLGLVRGLDYLIPLITLPYLISVLGLENFGRIEYAFAFAFYFGAVINYGFGVTAVRHLALARNEPAQVSAIFSRTLVAILLLIAATGAVFVISVSAIPAFREVAALYYFSFLQVAAQAFFPVWFYRGMERISLGAAITGISRVLYLVGILLLVKAPSDLVLVPALNSAVFFAAAVFSLILIAKKFDVRFRLPSSRDIGAVFRDGSNAFLAQLTPNFYNNSATFLLGAFAGPTAVGVLSAAKKVAEVFNSVGMILSNALFPYLLRNPNKVRIIHRLIWLLAIGLSVICVVAAELVVRLLFPDANEPIAHYLRILAFGILGYFGTVIYQTNGLMVLGRDDIVRRIAVFTSLLFFVLGLVAIPMVGIYGAIGMIVGARLTMAGLGLYHYRRVLAEDTLGNVDGRHATERGKIDPE